MYETVPGRQARMILLAVALSLALVGCNDGGGTSAPTISTSTGSGASSPVNPAAPQTWVEFGPRPMEFAFAFQGNMSGRVSALLVLDPDTLVLGSASGGIWRTTDARSPSGPDWVPTTDALQNLNIGALAR